MKIDLDTKDENLEAVNSLRSLLFQGVDTEKYREEKYREASDAWNKLEMERLTEIHSRLDVVTEKIKSGDRLSMLDLIEVTADTLLIFDTVSPELRTNFANGLKEIVSNLKPAAKGFLPRGRGERTVEQIREQEHKSFLTALRVEYYRTEHGLNLDEAKEKAAQESGMTESLVHKYWKNGHKTAKQAIKVGDTMTKIVNEACGIVTLPIEKHKKRYAKR